MFLLIDTNILLNLMIVPREEVFLSQLERLVELKLVKLLVPDTLIDEWRNKSKQSIQHFRKRLIELDELVAGETIMSDVMGEITEKSIRIDHLLAHGFQVRTKRKVTLEVANRMHKKQVPFQNDKPNIRDAYIFFAVKTFLIDKKSTDYVFITNNGTDFGNNGNKSTDLHEGLKVPELNCRYYSVLAKFFQDFKEQFEQYLRKEKGKDYPSSPIRIIKEDHFDLLTLIFNVLKITRQKMGFMPLEIFCRLYPFRIETKSNNYSHYSGSILYTNNVDLIDLFRHVDIENLRFKQTSSYKNTKRNLSKLKFIVSELNRHMIFTLQLSGTSDHISIDAKLPRIIPSSVIHWLKFNWKQMLKNIHSGAQHISKAQVLFQFGYFEETFVLFFEQYILSKQQKNKLQTFLILLNLKYLVSFLDDSKDEEVRKAISEIKAIEIEKEYFHFARSSRIDFEIAKFVRGGEDTSYYAALIKEDVENIQSNLELHLRSGRSSNGFVHALLDHFYIFEQYTVSNSWLYIKFAEFGKITSDFSKAIFMAVGLREYDTSHLKYMDEDIVHSLICWGKADQFIKLFARYVKSEITYKSNDTSIEKIMLSHFSIDDETWHFIATNSNKHFTAEYYRVSWNILLLLAIVRFDQRFTRKILNRLFIFVESLPQNESLQLKHLASVIHSRGELLTKTQLKKLFCQIINQKAAHDSDVFAALGHVASKKKFTLVDNNATYEQVVSFLKESCSCSELHIHFTASILKVTSKKYQLKLKDEFAEQLRKKFNRDAFYHLAMGGIIDPLPFLKLYINSLQYPGKHHHPIFEGILHARTINEYMNLMFKYKLPCDSKVREKIKGYNDYYDWLTDMENFDYKKFDPLWINQYPTQAYLENIFSIDTVKKNVRKYLQTHHQPTLASHYAQIVNG